jgi:hypothetical protein
MISSGSTPDAHFFLQLDGAALHLRHEGCPPPQWHPLIEPHIGDKHAIDFLIESIYSVQARNQLVRIARRWLQMPITIKRMPLDYITPKAFQVLFDLRTEMEAGAALRVHILPLHLK